MQAVNQASDNDSGHVRVPVVIEEEEETPPEDPLVVEARTAANKECDKVRWFTDLKELKEQLKIEVLASSHSVVFLQDAQTSRLKTNSTYLENIGELVQELDLRRWAVVVILGTRFDLIDPLVKRGQAIFKSNGRVMLCQLTPGKLQGKKIKGHGLPSSCVVVHPTANAPEIPYSAPILSVRAASVEQTQFRCCSRTCPLRSEEEAASIPAPGKPPVSEIPADDKEGPSDMCYEVDGESQKPSEDEIEVQQPPDAVSDDGPRDYPIDVFHSLVLAVLGCTFSEWSRASCHF